MHLLFCVRTVTQSRVYHLIVLVRLQIGTYQIVIGFKRSAKTIHGCSVWGFGIGGDNVRGYTRSSLEVYPDQNTI